MILPENSHTPSDRPITIPTCLQPKKDIDRSRMNYSTHATVATVMARLQGTIGQLPAVSTAIGTSRRVIEARQTASHGRTTQPNVNYWIITRNPLSHKIWRTCQKTSGHQDDAGCSPPGTGQV